ncbi:VOC family protein [Amycolatopsis sp. YIM 10]|uniref:VOC family protein n=1 Tax=Amycolatopsis sp. YIM 10 TaxID=2653857 RepID=UPI0012903D09|nr:VOC family protein [Amycolatopsis sp. YIM 10]QFU90152.1 Glyoxalase-like domain protein [Amycolatopsis sp. YIM 10]
MLRGLTTTTFYAEDMDAAKAWYTELLGIEPYFDRMPGYLEFRVGDYQHELGILNAAYAPPGARQSQPGGAIIHWHVDDIQAAFDRLLALGAKEFDPITERGPGFVTAAVTDPFGNVLGIMFNQHYLDILGEK